MDGCKRNENGPIQAIAFAGTGIRARLQLWYRNKHCYWCNRQAILFIPYTREQEIEGNRLGLNTTMDHVPNGGEWLVTACSQCNGLRNNLEHKVAARKLIRAGFIERWGWLLELWVEVGRPETVHLAQYAFTFNFHRGDSNREKRQRRKQALTTMVYQMRILAALRAAESG